MRVTVVYEVDDDEWADPLEALRAIEHEAPDGVTVVKMHKGPAAADELADLDGYDADELGLDPEEQ